MQERWTIYLDREYRVMPWPWKEKKFEDIAADDLLGRNELIDDFVRYSPSDGAIDMVHVPKEMPEEVPVCRTKMGICHDKNSIFVFLVAERSLNPIPELADCRNEDFSIVIPLKGLCRGLYFGMNEKNESIGCVQIWDPDVQPEEEDEEWPFSLLKQNPGQGPSSSRGGILENGYCTRCLPYERGIVGCFCVDKSLFAAVLESETFQFSAARRCYATSELVCWGSPVLWSPRPDKHGRIMLVSDEVIPSYLPVLYRVDVVYDPEKEIGEFKAVWRGPNSPDQLKHLAKGFYKNYNHRVSFVLNGIEETLEVEPVTSCSFPIPDGWNRLEVLTTFSPPLVLSFQKVSGNKISKVTPATASVKPPSLEELRVAFEDWHQQHMDSYQGAGNWNSKPKEVYCLCHNGIFHIEPYLYAWQYLEEGRGYERWIRETCERMLASQKPEGWYPSYCFSVTKLDREPELGEGGAFSNGSVGEGMAIAGKLLEDRRYLDSSLNAADYSWYRHEHNQNYAAFALWHLVALYEIEPKEELIRKALYYAENFVIRDLGLCGAQDGHNYFTGYGTITLKGLALLLKVLPEDHRFCAVLRDKVIRFTNQMLTRQQPNGLFAGRNRKYLGYHHLVTGLFFVADAVPEMRQELGSALIRMTQTILEKRDQDPEHAVGHDAGLALALMARYIKQND